MNKLLLYFGMTFVVLTSCNHKVNSVLNNEEDGKYYKNCSHGNNTPSLDLINRHAKVYSSFIQEYESRKSKSTLEIFYSYHCFECAENDRYVIFAYIDNNYKINTFKIYTTGVVIDAIDVISNTDEFLSKIMLIKHNFVRRDCSILDIENTNFYVKDLQKNELISCFVSVGLKGNILDNSNRYITQTQIIQEMLSWFPNQ